MAWLRQKLLILFLKTMVMRTRKTVSFKDIVLRLLALELTPTADNIKLNLISVTEKYDINIVT